MKLGAYARLRVSRFAALCIILSGLAVAVPVWAQESDAPKQDDAGTTDAPKSPLAPVVERDEEIRKYDPLAKSDEVAAELKRLADADKLREQKQTPIPGSIADSEQRVSPPESRVDKDASDSDNAAHEYVGPAVLTRSYTLGQAGLPKTLTWRETVSVGTSYDTGLGAVGPNGPASAGALEGTQLSWSISGGHAFRRDRVGASTSGTISLYPGDSYYSGSNDNLSVFWSHVISRRISINSNFGGVISSANSALTGFSAGPETIANVNLVTSPNIGIFDNGSKEGTLSSGVSWKISHRLSAGFNGTYFGVVRDSPLLYGVSGVSASGNLNYRLTRKMSVGGSYSFSQYVYPHRTQTSDITSMGAVFSYSLGRNMQIRFNGGISRVESLGFQTVALDPIIAAILGISEGVIDAYQSFSSGDMSAQFVRDFRKHGTVSLAYARGISPGNGLFQTSFVTSTAITYSTRLFRRYSFTLTGTRNQTSAAAGQASGAYKEDDVQMTLTQGLGRGTSMYFSASYRHYEISSFSSLRNQLTISSGFSWGNRNGKLIPF